MMSTEKNAGFVVPSAPPLNAENYASTLEGSDYSSDKPKVAYPSAPPRHEVEGRENYYPQIGKVVVAVSATSSGSPSSVVSLTGEADDAENNGLYDGREEGQPHNIGYGAG